MEGKNNSEKDLLQNDDEQGTDSFVEYIREKEKNVLNTLNLMSKGKKYVNAEEDMPSLRKDSKGENAADMDKENEQTFEDLSETDMSQAYDNNDKRLMKMTSPLLKSTSFELLKDNSLEFSKKMNASSKLKWYKVYEGTYSPLKAELGLYDKPTRADLGVVQEAKKGILSTAEQIRRVLSSPTNYAPLKQPKVKSTAKPKRGHHVNHDGKHVPHYHGTKKISRKPVSYVRRIPSPDLKKMLKKTPSQSILKFSDFASAKSYHKLRNSKIIASQSDAKDETDMENMSKVKKSVTFSDQTDAARRTWINESLLSEESGTRQEINGEIHKTIPIDGMKNETREHEEGKEHDRASSPSHSSCSGCSGRLDPEEMKAEVAFSSHLITPSCTGERCCDCGQKLGQCSGCDICKRDKNTSPKPESEVKKLIKIYEKEDRVERHETTARAKKQRDTGSEASEMIARSNASKKDANVGMKHFSEEGQVCDQTDEEKKGVSKNILRTGLTSSNNKENKTKELPDKTNVLHSEKLQTVRAKVCYIENDNRTTSKNIHFNWKKEWTKMNPSDIRCGRLGIAGEPCNNRAQSMGRSERNYYSQRLRNSINLSKNTGLEAPKEKDLQITDFIGIERKPARPDNHCKKTSPTAAAAPVSMMPRSTSSGTCKLLTQGYTMIASSDALIMRSPFSASRCMKLPATKFPVQKQERARLETAEFYFLDEHYKKPHFRDCVFDKPGLGRALRGGFQNSNSRKDYQKNNRDRVCSGYFPTGPFSSLREAYHPVSEHAPSNFNSLPILGLAQQENLFVPSDTQNVQSFGRTNRTSFEHGSLRTLQHRERNRTEMFPQASAAAADRKRKEGKHEHIRFTNEDRTITRHLSMPTRMKHGAGCRLAEGYWPIFIGEDITAGGPVYFNVLPGLYVGNFRDSKDSSQLREHGITHILAIHDNARKLPCNNDKEHLCILASDSPGQNLTQFFPVCNDFIHSARLKGGSVLIHCLAGMSRSVTVAVIYVMSVTTLNWRDALNAVRGARNVANPNVGFLKQLNEFDAERLTDERRRLKEKYPAYASMAQQDEAVAQEFLASYNLSLRLGETCDGECPVGSVCPRGLCNQRRSSGMFRRSSREKGGRPTPASAIITRNSSESLHSLQEQPSCASLQPDQQPAPITQPTPPPSPSRNRLTNEDEKSPPVSGNPSPQVSPSTSPKHSVAGIGQYASPSSPSRNYGYYTSSSAELTPPGSPYKGRGSQTSGVTVANKSNTVVWHQGTPPSSPKRSQRKQRSALSSFAKTQSSPKLMQHKLVAETESLPSAEKTDAEVATQNLQGAKSKSTLLSANRKSSFPCSVTSRKSNGVLPTQREEKVHLKHATLKMEKEKDTSSRIKIEPSNVVVKVTSPTSPPKKDLNEIKEKVETEQILVAESSVDKRVEPLRHVQNPKLSGMRRHKLNGIQRQSSLPDDGLLRPYDVPASSPSRNERPNIQLQKTPYPADGSTEKSSKEVGSSSSRFAKLDGTMSDNSFNSATLSYATLFYTPRQNLRSLSAPYTPRNNEKTTPQRDFQSIHVIKFPTPISSGGPRARHAIVAQSSFSGRPSSSAILRQRFAALNSHSFELDTRSFTEKTIKINGVAKRAYRINDNFNSALNNAPSLTQLSVSSEAKKEPQLNSKEGKSFSSNNNYKLNTELTKLKYKHPGQNISNGISWKSSDLSSVHEKLPSKVINANRGLSTVSTKRTLERENGTRNELCSAQSKFNANNLQGRNLETDYHKKEKLNHNTLVAHDLSSYCVSDEKNSITSDNISISSASVKNDNNLGTSERQKQHCSSNKKKRPSLDSSASLPVSCSQKVSPPTVNSTPPGKENSTSRPSESSECTPSGRSVKETSRPSAPFHLIQTKSASCSPPTNRMCQASELKCSSRSGSASNVPSWMRQTISRLLASTSQPHLRKANAHRREVSTSGREA